MAKRDIPGLYHYTSKLHALEMRSSYSRATWDALEHWSEQLKGILMLQASSYSSPNKALFQLLSAKDLRSSWD